MSDSGLDIINEMATGNKKSKVNKQSTEDNLKIKVGAEVDKKMKVSFKKERVRRIYKGSHIPEELAVKLEAKSREEGISESFLIQKIIEDWFNKYE